jgi:hypothetical protein
VLRNSLRDNVSDSGWLPYLLQVFWKRSECSVIPFPEAIPVHSVHCFPDHSTAHAPEAIGIGAKRTNLSGTDTGENVKPSAFSGITIHSTLRSFLHNTS